MQIIKMFIKKVKNYDDFQTFYFNFYDESKDNTNILISLQINSKISSRMKEIYKQKTVFV